MSSLWDQCRQNDTSCQMPMPCGQITISARPAGEERNTGQDLFSYEDQASLASSRVPAVVNREAQCDAMIMSLPTSQLAVNYQRAKQNLEMNKDAVARLIREYQDLQAEIVEKAAELIKLERSRRELKIKEVEYVTKRNLLTKHVAKLECCMEWAEADIKDGTRRVSELEGCIKSLQRSITSKKTKSANNHQTLAKVNNLLDHCERVAKELQTVVDHSEPERIDTTTTEDTQKANSKPLRLFQRSYFSLPDRGRSSYAPSSTPSLSFQHHISESSRPSSSNFTSKDAENDSCLLFDKGDLRLGLVRANPFIAEQEDYVVRPASISDLLQTLKTLCVDQNVPLASITIQDVEHVSNSVSAGQIVAVEPCLVYRSLHSETENEEVVAEIRSTILDLAVKGITEEQLEPIKQYYRTVCPKTLERHCTQQWVPLIRDDSSVAVTSWRLHKHNFDMCEKGQSSFGGTLVGSYLVVFAMIEAKADLSSIHKVVYNTQDYLRAQLKRFGRIDGIKLFAEANPVPVETVASKEQNVSTEPACLKELSFLDDIHVGTGEGYISVIDYENALRPLEKAIVELHSAYQNESKETETAYWEKQLRKQAAAFLNRTGPNCRGVRQCPEDQLDALRSLIEKVKGLIATDEKLASFTLIG